MKNRDRGRDLFNIDSTRRELESFDNDPEEVDIAIIIESKPNGPNSQKNLLTIEHFQEMIDF